MKIIHSILFAISLMSGAMYGSDVWFHTPKKISPHVVKPVQVLKGLLSDTKHLKEELQVLRAEVNYDKDRLSYNMYMRRLFARHKPFDIKDDEPLSPKSLWPQENHAKNYKYEEIGHGFTINKLPPSALSVLGRNNV